MKKLVFGAILFALSTPAHPCGSSAVCQDVGSSFTGVIIADGLRIEWSSNDEDQTIDSYVIRRYDCGTPASCLVKVATVNAHGACGTPAVYRFTDDPPDPDAQWTYRLELWLDGAEAPACSYDVVPE